MLRICRILALCWIGGLLVPVDSLAQEPTWTELNSRVVRLYQEGRFSEAIPMAQGALETARSLYGMDHPYVATSLNNLGALYHSTGRHSEAESLYRQALRIDHQLFGEDHPRVAVGRSNLAHLRAAERGSLPATGAEPAEPEPAGLAVLPPTGETPEISWRTRRRTGRRRRGVSWV